MRELLVVFASVLVAELGDKTQVATMLFATNPNLGKTGLFLAASAALVVSTFLAVMAGDFIARTVSPATLKMVAGVGFIAIGIWTLISAAR